MKAILFVFALLAVAVSAIQACYPSMCTSKGLCTMDCRPTPPPGWDKIVAKLNRENSLSDPCYPSMCTPNGLCTMDCRPYPPAGWDEIKRGIKLARKQVTKKITTTTALSDVRTCYPSRCTPSGICTRDCRPYPPAGWKQIQPVRPSTFADESQVCYPSRCTPSGLCTRDCRPYPPVGWDKIQERLRREIF